MMGRLDTASGARIPGESTMASVVIYFQIHQPYRLRKYTVFDESTDYFASEGNERILRKVAEKCYRPATRMLIDLASRHEGRFRVSFSISGTALDQLIAWAPDVIDLLRELVDTGCCELLAETSHHSLASLQSPMEFTSQVERHVERIDALFGQTPRIFRNTELIYSDAIAAQVAAMTDEAGRPRFDGMLAEGAEHILDGRTPNFVYYAAAPEGAPPTRRLPLLLKNFRLSDDIAFRFSNRDWGEWPLSTERFASWIDRLNDAEDAGGQRVCNLFMDYETFGEHQWAETGIFEFLDALPGAVLSAGGGRNRFETPREALRRLTPVDEFASPDPISWADTERDVSAWTGNAMQRNALEELYRLEARIKAVAACEERHGERGAGRAGRRLLADWRRLTTSDHFYYMCTKFFADGAVHTYFSHYESPYDSYINFVNVLDNVRERLEALEGAATPALRTRATGVSTPGRRPDSK